jgi:hypothetical protein
VAAYRDLTVRLPRKVIEHARDLAARRRSSISALVAETIEALAAEGEAYEAAKRLALEDLRRGLSLGGGPYLSRDEAHER